MHMAALLGFWPCTGLSWGEAVGAAEGGVGLRGEAQADGIEGLTDGAAKLRFGRDLRLVEVQTPVLPCQQNTLALGWGRAPP